MGEKKKEFVYDVNLEAHRVVKRFHSYVHNTYIYSNMSLAYKHTCIYIYIYIYIYIERERERVLIYEISSYSKIL